jgi:hypothetical protein
MVDQAQTEQKLAQVKKDGCYNFQSQIHIQYFVLRQEQLQDLVQQGLQLVSTI